MKVQSCFALLLLLCTCCRADSSGADPSSVPIPEQFVHNGDLTTIDRHPYLAAIYVYGFRGTGAIISDTVVLSGAHRFWDHNAGFYRAEEMSIRTASTHIQTSTNIFQVSEFIVHDRWWPQFLGRKGPQVWIYFYDVALLRLRSGQRFTGPLMRPVVLPNENEPVPANTLGTFAGWLNDMYRGSDEFVLRKSDMPVLYQNECRDFWTSWDVDIRNFADHHFCAWGYTLCWDDLGGPLVINGKLVGVSTWVDEPNCGYGPWPNVFERVSHPYIRQFIRNHAGV